MQKPLIMIACLLALFFVSSGPLGGKQVHWHTNYDEGISQARNTSKPALVLFTGSDWCSWCVKLEQEVFNKPEFAEAVGDRFVFIKLDFPINNPLPATQTARNKALQKQYAVQGFPMLVLLDSKQQKIGSVGYRPGGPKAYADYLMSMVGNFAAYQQHLQNLNAPTMSGNDLKQLYEQATIIGRTDDAMQILAVGITSDQEHFFKLEKYRLLAEQGKFNDAETKQLRGALLTADPNNLKLTHYQIAVIDFEAMNKMTENQGLTASSLIEYTEKFGTQDKDNLWRIQMIISQIYFDQDNVTEALRYAQLSHQTAPTAARSEIASAIKHMQVLTPERTTSSLPYVTLKQTPPRS